MQQEVLIKPGNEVFCSCQKPSLFHIPCSHLIAACSLAGVQAELFVSPYFTKQAAVQTWSHEVYCVGIFGSFTEDNKPKMFIPDEKAKRGRGRQQTRRIRNGMDESEAGKIVRRCSQCGQEGHNYKKCHLNAIAAKAEAGPSGNPNDGAPPDFRQPYSHRRASFG